MNRIITSTNELRKLDEGTIIQSVETGAAYQVYLATNYFAPNEIKTRSFLGFGTEEIMGSHEVALPAEVVSNPVEKVKNEARTEEEKAVQAFAMETYENPGHFLDIMPKGFVDVILNKGDDGEGMLPVPTMKAGISNTSDEEHYLHAASIISSRGDGYKWLPVFVVEAILDLIAQEDNGTWGPRLKYAAEDIMNDCPLRPRSGSALTEFIRREVARRK